MKHSKIHAIQIEANKNSKEINYKTVVHIDVSDEFVEENLEKKKQTEIRRISGKTGTTKKRSLI